MANPDRHLLELFFRLRDELGLPLQVEDFELLVDAWEAGFQPETYPELKQLCRRLWVKSPADQARFEDCFDSYLAELFYDAYRSYLASQPRPDPETDPDSPVPSPPSRASATQTPPPRQPRTARSRSHLGSSAQVVQAIARTDSTSERVPLGQYNLNDEYFPVKRRELRHGWKRLRQLEYSGWSDDWDIPAVVQQISQQGLLLNPVYLPAKVNRASLLLLIDRSNSMAPFDLMAERLIATAEQATVREDLADFNVLYFRNSPRPKLFADRDLLQPVWLDELLPQLSELHTVALTFSDAGAARRGFNLVRREVTHEFVDLLKPHVRQMAWLNPLPRHRWLGTTADEIAQALPMFALDLTGWRSLLKQLRGQGQMGWQRGSADTAESLEPDTVSQQRLRRQLRQLVQASPQPEKYNTAIDQVVYWAGKDDKALTLLGHWAFPLALTPDLLYYLRENFVADSPWVLGADLLLSSFCRTVGYQLYEIDPLMRHVALKWLMAEDALGQERLHQLSDSLLYYMQHRLEGTQRLPRDFGENPEWIALAYVEPNALAYEVAQALCSYLQSDNVAEQIRLSSLMATLAEPLEEANFQHLLHLSRGLSRRARGDEAGAVSMFEQIPGDLRNVSVEDIVIPIPGRAVVHGLRTFEFEVPTVSFEAVSDLETLETYEFETVKVDSTGREVERYVKIAHYYVEVLNQSNQNFFGRVRDFVSLRRFGRDSIPSIEMVAVPAGTFMMGSPETEKKRQGYESPQHEVSVPAFFMSRYPITQAQWKAIAELDPVERELKANPSRFKANDLPVERVNWYDAVEFCARLSRLTGRDYRLPTEAEWEYACRAGTTTPFAFGETLTSELANYRASRTYADEAASEYREQTTPVGTFPANDFGLYDMHGNVWEWCLDHWHDSYEGAPTDGSAWLFDGEGKKSDRNRVLRGGSWNNNPEHCRSACRTYNYPALRDVIGSYQGFRVVSSAARDSS